MATSVQTRKPRDRESRGAHPCRATRSGMCGVHGIYDFAVSACPGQPPVSASVAAVTDLVAADLAPRFLHPDLVLLPIRPMH
jgi:hypothetical protein